MKLEVSYHREAKLGVFKLTGAKDFPGAKATWEQMGKAISKDNAGSLLVFDDAVSTLSGVEVLDLVQWLRDTRFPYDVKVAIVDAKLPAGTNNAFGETLVQNRGWSLIRDFADEAMAREWLSGVGGGSGTHAPA